MCRTASATLFPYRTISCRPRGRPDIGQDSVSSACDGTKTVAELAGLLVEGYGISVEQATADTVTVLDLWRELDMFEA